VLSQTFIHLPGIGPVTERELWANGIRTWDDFIDCDGLPGRAGRQADLLQALVRQSRERLRDSDAAYFAATLPNSELWRLYGDFRHRAAFLDIETTGLSPEYAEITMVGLLDFGSYRAFVHGENLEELREAIEEYDLVVTFNGASFDLPFIEYKFGRMFARTAHIDLMFPLRNLGLRGGLKAIEKRLRVGRPSELSTLNGFDAVRMWHMWQMGDAGARRTLIRYNAEDVASLPRLADIVYNRLADRLGVPGGRLDSSPVPDISLPFDGEVIRRLALTGGHR
jgi:uncharacterized protein YprB with RNaseH-like and TPR domain